MYSKPNDSILFIHTAKGSWYNTIDSTDFYHWNKTWKTKGRFIYNYGNRNIKRFFDSSDDINADTHRLFKDCDFHFDGLKLGIKW